MKPLRETLYALINEHKIETILILSVLTYTAVFSYFTYLKHYTFSSYAWDLGVFNQLLHDTVFEGKPFYYTPDLYFNGSGSYFVIHFSPILVLLLPIYYLFPGVTTLLGIKALLLASAAIPLFFLSNILLKDKKLSLYISLVYLLYPGLQGANWFDFQQQVFLPLLLFTTLYLFMKERWELYPLTFLLTLMIFELSFVIVIVSLLCLQIYDQPRDLLNQFKQFKPNKVHITILTTLFGTVYYFIAKWLMSGYVINPLFKQQYLASSVFNVIQYSGNTVLLPLYILTHLADVIQALSYDPVLKLLYIVFLFGPLLFLPLTTRSIIPTLLLLSPFLLSNYQAYYMIGSHYSLYLIVPIFIALILVYAHHFEGEKYRLARKMLTITVLFAVLISPLSPVSNILNSKTTVLWYPPSTDVTDRVNKLHHLIDEVPKSASILTQNHIFPHFSDRINAYVLPALPPNGDQERYLKNYIDELVSKSDYILLDLRTYDASTSYVFENALSKGSGHKIASYEDSAVLITREDVAGVNLADSYPRIYTVNSGLYVGKGTIIHDPTSETGNVAESTSGSREGHLVYGPYEFMNEGAYRLTFSIKPPSNYEGYLGTFDVYDSGNVVTKRDIYGYEVTPGNWTKITIILVLKQAKAAVEFRFEASDLTTILFDDVHVEMLPDPTPRESTRSVNSQDLNVATSRVTADRLITSTANGQLPLEVAWFGPYLNLPAGNYTVTYHIKPTKLTQTTESPIFYADIATRNGRQTLVGKWVKPEELQAISDGWYKLTLNLSLGQETELEFRGSQLQPGWTLSLGQILIEPNTTQ
ncbi:MAG: DUF2079 domain-containing protein [Candidatus Bathyarchaeota archaeon]|nr:DUF2079 domain-containing protein [Candidatus Bathyarchaeota archaeon]